MSAIYCELHVFNGAIHLLYSKYHRNSFYNSTSFVYETLAKKSGIFRDCVRDVCMCVCEREIH